MWATGNGVDIILAAVHLVYAQMAGIALISSTGAALYALVSPCASCYLQVTMISSAAVTGGGGGGGGELQAGITYVAIVTPAC